MPLFSVSVMSHVCCFQGGSTDLLTHIAASNNAVYNKDDCCREATLELLKRGWPLGEESKYDTNHALVLCRMHGFTPGLRFLYERMRHFREVLQV